MQYDCFCLQTTFCCFLLMELMDIPSVSKFLVSQFLTMFKTFGITTKVFRARKSFLLQYFWSVIKETKIFLLGMQTIACHVKCGNFLVTLL